MRTLIKFLYLFGALSLFLLVLYRHYYADGSFVLGGEGSYYTDAILLLKNYGFLWYNGAVGFFATSFNFVFHSAVIQWLFGSERIVNFVNIASLYVLPFIAIYLLCLHLKLRPILALLVSVFYLANPFTLVFLQSINPWNMLATYIFPAYLLIILAFYDRKLLLFFIFGIHSLIFNFTNANPPTMILFQLAIPVSVVLASILRNGSFRPAEIVSRYLIVISSFFLFNIWWIINWFFVLSEASAGYTTTYALGWLKSAGWQRPVLWRAFSLNGLLPFPRDSHYDFLASYFGNSLGELLSMIPIILVVFSLLKQKFNDLSMRFLGIVLIIVGFLAKGTNPPFGSFYEWCIKYLPFFKIFKTAPEKWGVYFTFLLTLYLILFLRKLERGWLFGATITLLTIYTLFAFVPYVTGNFLPDYRFNVDVYGSKRFNYKKEYLELRQTLNNDPLQYRVLSLPGSNNYQVALRLDEGQKFYTGNDPILNNTNKPFIAPYNNFFTHDFDVLFDNISDPNYLRILRLYNIKKIVIMKNMFPWFGYRHLETVDELEKIFGSLSSQQNNPVYSLYDIGDSFLPRLYVADQAYATDLPQEGLPKLFKNSKISSRPAIFNSNVNNLFPKTVEPPPKLIFQKINPTKYKLRLEGIKKPFILVFQENFHHGWQLFPAKKSSLLNQSDIVGSYFGGSIQELRENPNFFDKNLMDTWGENSIASEQHLTANGYANSWIIRPEDLNGNENIELILEYWPQRLLYLGAAITLATALISFILLILSRRKK